MRAKNAPNRVFHDTSTQSCVHTKYIYMTQRSSSGTRGDEHTVRFQAYIICLIFKFLGGRQNAFCGTPTMRWQDIRNDGLP